ncbi:YihE protein, required for LPS synthesis [hydrothermal vent metagenome]|uniref:YihE protein, required for LPS synthesis n=1 Tax=hydrothermal vent metagenome TaxID=652676 RepID=A0A3B0WV36_9ZZZZ
MQKNSLKLDYTDLTPETILSAVESAGYETSGRLLALNSYENRVYRCELEGVQEGSKKNDTAIITKFYRPGRWSDAAIAEEHQFALELLESEIPVVAPIIIDGVSLFQHQGYRFSIYPLRGGRWPDLESRDDLNWMGRFIARIHNVGRTASFEQRHQIEIKRMGFEPAAYLQEHKFIPDYLQEAYQTLTDDLLKEVQAAFDRCGSYQSIRLHGDCHRSNVLWTDDGPHFVDLDDCCNGPAIQDLWMLLSGERQEMTEQLCDLLEGYEEFAELDLKELHLIEALRSLRMMHYAAWLAKRWEDSAFPLAFPWFNTNQYWEQHVLELREQLSRLHEPILVV